MSFRDLLGFDKLIAIPIIRIVYWVGNVGLVLALLGVIGSVFTRFGMSAVQFLTAIFALIFGFLIWRLSCEMWIVAFGIYERLGDIRDQGKGMAPTAPGAPPAE